MYNDCLFPNSKWGFATTRAKLICKGRRDVILDSQLPSALNAKKLSELERGPLTTPAKEDEIMPPPQFVTQVLNKY